MDIRQLLRDLRQNFVVVFLAFIICVAAGGAAAFLPAKQYQASTQLLLSVSPNTADPAGAVSLIQFLILELPSEATSPSTLSAARNLVPPADAHAAVTVTAQAPPTTDVLTISVTASDAGVAAIYANAIATHVINLQPVNNLYLIKTLSAAKAPTTPSNPTKPLLVGAVGFGLIAAVFAGMASAGVRRRFSRVNELKERIGATVLGEIPRVISGNIRPSSLFVLGRQPMVMEAFQELRSNLLLSIPDGGPTSIAVTSCDPSEGKTSVVANIAWALAAEGRHITAVDSDLRKPMLHLELEVPFGPGLASGGAADALRHASQTKNPYLDVVPAGIPAQHPSDVVSAYLPPLLDSLRERRQTIIVDCPPMIGVAETVLIAAMVDMVVVVVDTRRLHPERLQDCLLRLDNAGANVIGIVLNRTRRRRRGAYNYGYYGHEDAKLVPTAPAPAPGEAPVVVARNRWVGGSPSADKPVQVVPQVQSVGAPGRQGRSGRAEARLDRRSSGRPVPAVPTTLPTVPAKRSRVDVSRSGEGGGAGHRHEVVSRPAAVAPRLTRPRTGPVTRLSLPRSLRWGVALALFAVAVATVAHAVPNGGDFRLSIWYPGQAMWHGRDPYDIASFERFYGSHQVEAFSKGWFPLYGPIHLWLALFFALFPVKVAAVLYFVVNVAGLLVMATVVTRALDRRLGAPAVLAVTGLLMLTRPGRATVESGQATVIYSLLVYLVWSQARRRPWLAALALAAALGKPPFGLPLLAIVLFRRLWPLAVRAVAIFVAASLPIVIWLSVNAGSLAAVARAIGHNLSYTDHNPLDAPGSPGRIDALSLIARYSHGHFGGGAEVAAFVVIMGLVAILVARVSGGPGWPLSPPVVLALGLATVLCVAHEYYDLLLLAWPFATVLRGPVVFVLDRGQATDGSALMAALRARLGGRGHGADAVPGDGAGGTRWSGWLALSAAPALVVTVLPAHETLKVLGLGTGTSIISTVTTASLLLALVGTVAVLAFGGAKEDPSVTTASPGRHFPSLGHVITVEPAVVEPAVVEPALVEPAVVEPVTVDAMTAEAMTLDVNPADSG